MKDYIEERVLEVAQYIIDSKATIRKTAKVFGVSKSTIHKDMTERLPKINPAIAEQTHLILELNKSERPAVLIESVQQVFLWIECLTDHKSELEVFTGSARSLRHRVYTTGR